MFSQRCGGWRNLHCFKKDFARRSMSALVKCMLREGFSCLAAFMHGNRSNSPKEVQKHEES